MAETFERATGAPARPSPAESPAEAARGTGWVTFAAIMLAIIGALNFIYGIAAISNSKFYVGNASYVLSDLNTYGWVLLVVGIAQLLVALGIYAGTRGARWLGVLAAGVNAIAQLLYLPAYPFLALAIFAIDVLVIYGLVVYGGRRAAV